MNMTSHATEPRRIWIPSADVDDRAMLMVELPEGMERPTKAEHYDFMESKVIGLLAKNSDAQNKRLIIDGLRDGRDLVWGGPDGYAGGIMATDQMRALCNEIDWEVEGRDGEGDPEYTQAELRELFDEETLGDFLSGFPRDGWD